MKYKLFIAATVLIAACKGGAGKTEDTTKDTTQQIINAVGGTSIDSANEPGQRLIAANDCFTCHYIDRKSIGPSYRQIANRYESNEGNVENLANRIIKGATGLWSTNRMTPHPNISYQQAQAMAAYILSLRNAADTTTGNTTGTTTK
ncbi:MAG: c-type cytochrome [Parafilimonas sp.]|nr:c-type cytochrome [Parafilimonas sp.]